MSRKYHDLIIGSEQEFEVSTDTSFSMKAIAFSGSKENSDFYDYIRFLSEVKPQAMELQEKMPDPRAEKQLEELNRIVRKKQEEIIDKYEASISGLIVLNSREPDIPEFEGSEEEIRIKRYQYYKDHYFDHLDLRDERLMRTPFFYSKVDQYVTQVSPQIPDSIMVALDRVLLPMHESNPDAFRFFLSHFLNKYAKSKIVGLDAVYVHLAQNYYGQGLADWVGEETLSKILDEAQKKSTVLIGNAAPDISLLRLPSNEKLQLYDIESPYTVLYFWDPDCGHCKKQTPDVISFYKEYKDKGVEVVAICTKLNKDAEQECLKSIEEKEDMEILTNAYDPFLRSRYKQKYDIRSTPRIYILDREKKIIMKGISGNKLPEVMDHVMKDQDKS
jgi:thiol-disulfide isomerase/thioredoxin